MQKTVTEKLHNQQKMINSAFAKMSQVTKKLNLKINRDIYLNRLIEG